MRLVEELGKFPDVRPVLPFPFVNSIYAEGSPAFAAQRRWQALGFRPSHALVRDLGGWIDRRLERALLRSARFDVFQPTYFRDYFSDLLGDRPFVLWVPDMIPEIFPETWERSPHDDKNALLPRAAAIIAISATTRRDLQRFHAIPDERVVVAPLGAPFETPPVRPAPPLPDEYLLFVGKRPGYKNFLRFARVVGALMQRRPSLHLLCAGGGGLRDEEAEVFRAAGCLDRVSVRKPDEDELQWLYRRARVFVYPSWYEGFGLPILEAFAAGCPAALADSDVFREVAGDAAVFFDPLDEDAMRAALERLLDDEALRRHVLARAATRLLDFTWRRMAEQCAAVYRSVAHHGAANPP